MCTYCYRDRDPVYTHTHTRTFLVQSSTFHTYTLSWPDFIWACPYTADRQSLLRAPSIGHTCAPPLIFLQLFSLRGVGVRGDILADDQLEVAESPSGKLARGYVINSSASTKVQTDGAASAQPAWSNRHTSSHSPVALVLCVCVCVWCSGRFKGEAGWLMHILWARELHLWHFLESADVVRWQLMHACCAHAWLHEHAQ